MALLLLPVIIIGLIIFACIIACIIGTGTSLLALGVVARLLNLKKPAKVFFILSGIVWIVLFLIWIIGFF